MAKIAGLVGVLMVACLLSVSNARSASASDPPTMRLDPASVKIQGMVGATFTVDVVIDGVTNLGGFEFEIHYDESSLDLTDIREGPFLGGGGGSTTCVEQGPPTFEGLGRLSCIVLGKQGAPSGSGVVGELDFSLEIPFFAPGQLQLFLMACDAADSQGDAIALNGCKDGGVIINAVPTATPTPRPVGGIAFDADERALPSADVPSRGGDAWVEIVLALVTAALVASGALGAIRLARRGR